MAKQVDIGLLLCELNETLSEALGPLVFSRVALSLVCSITRYELN